MLDDSRGTQQKQRKTERIVFLHYELIFLIYKVLLNSSKSKVIERKHQLVSYWNSLKLFKINQNFSSDHQ